MCRQDKLQTASSGSVRQANQSRAVQRTSRYHFRWRTAKQRSQGGSPGISTGCKISSGCRKPGIKTLAIELGKSSAGQPVHVEAKFEVVCTLGPGTVIAELFVGLEGSLRRQIVGSGVQAAPEHNIAAHVWAGGVIDGTAQSCGSILQEVVELLPSATE